MESQTERNDLAYWKEKSILFLQETSNLTKRKDVVDFRNELIDILHNYVGGDSIHLLQRIDQASDLVIYSSDQSRIASFTDISLADETLGERPVMFVDKIKTPGRSHLLYGMTSVVFVPITEVYFKGCLLMAWKEPFNFTAGHEIFLLLCVPRLSSIMRLLSTAFEFQDLRLRFDAVFHTTSSGLICVDNTGNTSWINGNAKRILGLHGLGGEELPPVMIAEAMRLLREQAINADEINTTASELFKDSAISITHWLWKFKDKVYSVATSPMVSERIQGRLWVFEDISGLYFANASLAQAKKDIETKNERLEALNQEKDDLIGIVSHDLRSPLSQIQMLINLIKMEDADIPEEQLSLLNMVSDVSDKGLKLINDLLDISTLEQQQSIKRIERLDLHRCVTEALAQFHSIAAEKNIAIHVVTAQPSVWINGDREFLRRILDNLVSNALKFSYPNKSITLALSHKNEQVIMSIVDQGQGIKENEMDKLFGKFSKLSARPTGNESSTGLGLYIVKSLIEEMAGKIHCTSIWQQGTTFVIEFPMPAS